MRGRCKPGIATRPTVLPTSQGKLLSGLYRASRSYGSLHQPILPKSRYYQAIGTIIDVALSRILGDVLALEDITAEESNKLSELCRIMNSLEGLFVENPDLVSDPCSTFHVFVLLNCVLLYLPALLRRRLRPLVVQVLVPL